MTSQPIQSEVKLAGWLPALPSRSVRGSRIGSIVRYGEKLVLWRNKQGSVGCMPARCPHWGADLSGGRNCAGMLQCPLHGWSFAADGSCPEHGQFPTLPTHEFGGMIYVWWGSGSPLFPFPSPNELTSSHRQRIGRVSQMNVHPTLATMNGLDLQHWKHVHGLDAEEIVPLHAPHEWCLSMTVQLTGGMSRWIPGPPTQVTISTWGAHLCVLDNRSWWGRTWTVLANAEAESGSYITAQQVVAEARWPLANRILLLFDALLTKIVLTQDRKALAGWQPRMDRLRDEAPWNQYLPIIERLPTWSADSDARQQSQSPDQ